MSDYFVYYKNAFGEYRTYNPQTKKFKTIAALPWDSKKFEMLNYDDLEANDADLKAYAKHFAGWCCEMLEDRYCNIDYADKFCNSAAVATNFNRRAAKNYQKGKTENYHKPITKKEWLWMERCYNSGLQYLSEIDITIRCYSNDFKNQYPRCMNSKTRIPTRGGKEVTLNKLPRIDKLAAGFYHVKIRSNNDNFRKIFSYSRENVYVKESLEHAMKYAKQFDVTFKLVQDGKPNAYLYRDEKVGDMVTLESVCGEWFQFMRIQRGKFPKNRLLKHMFSSCWSTINGGNHRYMTWEEIQKQKLDVGYGTDYDYQIKDSHCNPVTGVKTYKLLDTNSPYKHDLRLKPWVTALSRNLTAQMALKDIDHVIRIQTDSVSWSVDQEITDKMFPTEEKTTGKMHFLTVNSYKNLTTGYKSGFYEKNNRKDEDEEDD